MGSLPSFVFRSKTIVKLFQLTVDKDGHSYFATLEIKNVTVEDAGKYKVTAKNELGESNATISLNFDSKYLKFEIIINPCITLTDDPFYKLLCVHLLNFFHKCTLNALVN